MPDAMRYDVHVLLFLPRRSRTPQFEGRQSEASLEIDSDLMGLFQHLPVGSIAFLLFFPGLVTVDGYCYVEAIICRCFCVTGTGLVVVWVGYGYIYCRIISPCCQGLTMVSVMEVIAGHHGRCSYFLLLYILGRLLLSHASFNAYRWQRTFVLT